ncbi:hypothetical protein [Streptomyces hydrogenans]
MRELLHRVEWAERALDAGRWRPGPGDSAAAAAVRARLAAPLPARPDADARDRRLQRLLRTVLHHLDGGAVSPPAAALLAAMARAFLPWHAFPNPPVAAAAPAYGTPVRAADGPWRVTCDWRVAVLGCACGAETREHGLAFSEIWLPSAVDG